MFPNYEPFTPEQEIETINLEIVENFTPLAEIKPEQRKVIDVEVVDESDLFVLKLLARSNIHNTLQYWANLSSITEVRARLICFKYGINIQPNEVITPISILGVDVRTFDVIEHLKKYYGKI
jgi:hypothetical protein